MLQWFRVQARKNWFIIGIVFSIAFAHYKPAIGRKGGPLMPEFTVKYVAVFMIFFNSGLSLRTEDLTRAISQIRLHLYIQSFTLLFVPCLIQMLVYLLESSPIDEWLLKGLLVVGSIPPPVSSAVIITKAIGGNEAAAIFNSALGSFLGIFVTPMWLLYFLGSTSQVPIISTFLHLAMTVVFPVYLGQVVRSHAKYKIQRLGIPFGAISSIILLLIIYTTFCDTFTSREVHIDELSLFTIVFLVLIFQISLLFWTFYVSNRPVLNFSPQDVVTCLFCSTHKSLTLGIPILKIMFSNHPQLSVISIPLLVYHPTQILLGSLLVPTVKGWMLTVEKYRYRRYAYQV